MDNPRLSDFSHQKRGMSPLIATVLLIAFAVALGAMIMNWSATFGDETPDCSTVTMIISPYLCYGDEVIKVSVKNTGDPVESITLRVIDDIAKRDITLEDSKLDKGSRFSKDIPFKKSGSAEVELIPSIRFKDRIVECDEPALSIEDLPNC